MRNLTTTVLRNLGMLITDIGWKFVELGHSIELYNHPPVKCRAARKNETDDRSYPID